LGYECWGRGGRIRNELAGTEVDFSAGESDEGRAIRVAGDVLEAAEGGVRNIQQVFC